MQITKLENQLKTIKSNINFGQHLLAKENCEKLNYHIFFMNEYSQKYTESNSMFQLNIIWIFL